MGSGKSKIEYSDNSSQINQSLSNIRTQINELNNDIHEFKTEIDTHVNTVQKNFNIIDNKILLIKNEFVKSFNYLDFGIKMIGDNIKEMSRLQIEYEKTNSKEHWEIFKNDWKENFERQIFQEFQRLKNIKFQLELDLNNKVISYLLIKDQFNQKVIFYQEKNSQYRINLLQKQINLILINMDLGQNRELITLSQSSNLIQHDLNELELIELEKSVRMPPILDDEIMGLFTDINKFQEIADLQIKLMEQTRKMLINFSNHSLINPLDDIITSSEDFANKLIQSGIKSMSEISILYQDTVLISNGYAYVPDYKYNDLKKKFIDGCEKLNIKLDFRNEDINLLSQYLYSKVELKSISSIVEYLKSPECVYQIDLSYFEDFDNIGLIGLELYKGYYESSKNTQGNLLELEYENQPIIFYNILKYKNISDVGTITNKMITSLGYKPVSLYVITTLQQILIKFDLDERFGKRVFINNLDIIEENKKQLFNFENSFNRELINSVVSKFINKKKLGELGSFNFPILNKQIYKEFFNSLVIILLKKYLEDILNIFDQRKVIKTDLDNKLNILKISDFNFLIITIFKFNKSDDIKNVIQLVFYDIHHFCWNKLN